MTAVALASRFDVLWIAGCVLGLGLMAVGAGMLYDQRKKAKRRAEARAYLLRRLDEFCQPPDPTADTVIEQARKAWALREGDGITPIRKGRTR